MGDAPSKVRTGRESKKPTKTNAPEGASAPLVLPRVSTLLLRIEHACSFTSIPDKSGAAAGISTCCSAQVSLVTMTTVNDDLHSFHRLVDHRIDNIHAVLETILLASVA
jgi:hypothetical protein